MVPESSLGTGRQPLTCMWTRQWTTLLNADAKAKIVAEDLFDEFNPSPPEKARAVLGQFGLPGTSHFVAIGSLFGGQMARVAFAALMLQKTHICVSDKPTNH